MKRTEFWLAVCIYAFILLTSFSGQFYLLMNKPLLSEIESFLHSGMRESRGAVFLIPSHTHEDGYRNL